MKRQKFLADLRILIKKHGSENVVYFDESGFEKEVKRRHGWALKGRKIYGDFSGKRYKRTNLLMAQRGKEWLAPMLFEGSCNSNIVNAWIEEMLLKELNNPSIVIMDNAAFHQKAHIHKLLEKHGHILLPLPPYSPDFNPIEQSFGAIKKRQEFANNKQTIDALLMSYF